MLPHLLLLSTLTFPSALPRADVPTDPLLQNQASDPHAALKTLPSRPDEQKAQRPRNIRMVEETPDGKALIFESNGKPPGAAFRTGYFGMPIVLRPFDSSDKEMQLITGNELLTFNQEGQGFRLTSSQPLPQPPSDSLLQEFENAPTTGIWTKETLTQSALFISSDIGYQIGGDGTLFWVGSAAIFKHSPEGWKSVFRFPKEFMARRRNAFPRAGIIVLPDNRIALFGGEDFFIKIIELREVDDKEEEKIIKTFNYDNLGCTKDNYPGESGPQFCISGGSLYFHLRKTGHLFRLKLDSWTLTDYDVPWMAQEFTKPGAPLKWKNTQGSSNVSQPVVPESMSFAIDWDGSVHVTALMFNMPTAALHCFAASSEGSTIHSDIKTGSDLADPITYENSMGELVPIKTALDVLRTQQEKTPHRESTTPPTPASSLDKPAPSKEEK